MSWVILGHLGVILRSSQVILGSSVVILGSSWGHLGSSQGQVGGWCGIPQNLVSSASEPLYLCPRAGLDERRFYYNILTSAFCPPTTLEANLAIPHSINISMYQFEIFILLNYKVWITISRFSSFLQSELTYLNILKFLNRMK